MEMDGLGRPRRRRSRGGKEKRKLTKKGIEVIEAEPINGDGAGDAVLHNGAEEKAPKITKEKPKKAGKKGQKNEDMVVKEAGDEGEANEEVTEVNEEVTEVVEKKKKMKKDRSKKEETDEKMMPSPDKVSSSGDGVEANGEKTKSKAEKKNKKKTKKDSAKIEEIEDEKSTSGKKRKRKSKQSDDGSSSKMPKLNQEDGKQAELKKGRKKTKTEIQSAKLKMKQEKKEAQKKAQKKVQAPTRDVFNFTTPRSLFASLIAPCKVDKFFKTYWEKRPMVINRTKEEYAESYKELFSRKALEDILTKKGLEFGSDVNVCKFNGKERVSMNGEGRASCKKVKRLLDNDRATVQFHQPQRFQDKLWQVNEKLESFFHSLVGANIYMTPEDSQGLAPHYDDVDVFVLQLEGEKRWKLYDPPIQLPRDYSKDLDKSTIGKFTHNILLKPGDMMYFPRGTIHQAVTPANSPSHSTHVTISTYQRSSWGDLMSMALPGILQSAIDEDVEFRTGLPHMYLRGDQESFAAHQSHIKELLEKLGDHLGSHDQAAANEMMCDLIANRLPPFTEDGAVHEPKGPMPSEESEVKLAFPDHIYVTRNKHTMMGKPEEDEDYEVSTEEEDDDIEEDDEDDEDEEEDEEDAEEDAEEEDEDAEEEEEEEEEEDKEDGEEDEDEEMAISDGSYLEQIMTGDKDDDDDEDDDDDDDGDEEKDYFYVYHSFKNTREGHMMTSEPPQFHGLKFPLVWMATMKQLTDSKDNWTAVSKLAEPEGRMQLIVSLWSEGLLHVK